jgi:hypothetical protein
LVLIGNRNISTTKNSLIQCLHERFGVDREQEHQYNQKFTNSMFT